MASGLELEPLMLLLQAPSKDVVARIFNEAFQSRGIAARRDLPASLTSVITDNLAMDENELDMLLRSLFQLITTCLYECPNEDGIQALFPQDFHPQLRRLLAQMVAKQLPHWKEQAIKSQVGLPHLESVSWEVLQPKEEVHAPKAILNLKLKDSTDGDDSSVSFEVPKVTLTAMLDSLYSLRDQLDSIWT